MFMQKYSHLVIGKRHKKFMDKFSFLILYTDAAVEKFEARGYRKVENVDLSSFKEFEVERGLLLWSWIIGTKVSNNRRCGFYWR